MRSSTLGILAFGIACSGAALLTACNGLSLSGGDCSDDLTCGGPGATDASVIDGSKVDGAAADGGGEGGIDGPPGCDTSKSPSDDPCVIDNLVGVFVNSQASDAGPALGTKELPLRTIAEALALAKAAGKRVYVCEGNYPETLLVDAAVDGTKLYGGFSCSTWIYDSTKKVVVKPTLGIPLKISNATSALFVDVAFEAAKPVPSRES